jgi:tRNA(adenine34) deaminase
MDSPFLRAMLNPLEAPLPVGHDDYMKMALAQARLALAAGEVPIGAVLVSGGDVVGEGFNQPIAARDPTAHAEIVAFRQAAAATGNYRLSGSTLYVTVEPCVMCLGASFNARIDRLVYGTDEPKFGAVRSVMRAEDLRLNHRFEIVGGVREEECRGLMVDFFRGKRSRDLG